MLQYVMTQKELEEMSRAEIYEAISEAHDLISALDDELLRRREQSDEDQ